MAMQATLETDETRPPRLLTVSEAARLAYVSRPHLYRLVKRGEVPALRVGEGHGPIRIPAAEFKRWLQTTRTGPTGEGT
jgi:excisionase family DNA binding protein